MFLAWRSKAVPSSPSSNLRRGRHRPLVESLEQRCMLAVTITEFPVPSAGGAITSGPDGNLWFAARGAIGRITPTGVVTELPLPVTIGGTDHITAGPDGNVWFTTPNGIGRITATGVVSEFPLPRPHQNILGITAGPDGNVWFTEIYASAIGRITPAGVMTEYSAGAGSFPVTITSGPDGNLWVTYSITGNIARFTPAGTFMSAFSLPVIINGSIVFDPDGNLWAAVDSGVEIDKKIARRTPAAVLTLFSGFKSNEFIGHLAPAPDGSIWFLDIAHGLLGRITPAGSITEFPALAWIPTGPFRPNKVWLGGGLLGRPLTPRAASQRPSAAVCRPAKES